MPPAKHSTSPAPSTFKEPAALKSLSSSLDTAQQALVELREDTGRDVHQGTTMSKDLRAFISSARRDAGKLAKALQRDFDQAQKQLAQGTGTAGEARAKTTSTKPASRSNRRRSPSASRPRARRALVPRAHRRRRPRR